MSCRTPLKTISAAVNALATPDCRRLYPHALYMGVGGTYDVFTGHVHRAPKFWQDLGLEWFYRLLLQPSRIKRQFRLLRYLRWHYSGKL